MRPTIPKARHRQQIALTLPPMLIAKAKAFAEIGGVPVSRMVEESLTNWLWEAEKQIRSEHNLAPRKP